MRGVSIGECYQGILWEMMNHKSLFSSCAFGSVPERDRGCLLNLLSRCLFSSQFCHFCPALSILSPLLGFWTFRRNRQTEQNGPRRRFWETGFFPPFLGGCAHQADTWHSIFLCAHINDSVAYWNYRVGSSGKIAEEFWDSGQMLDAQYKPKHLRQ